MRIWEQIKAKPKMHGGLFGCWFWALILGFSGGNWEAFIAAGFVITAFEKDYQQGLCGNDRD